MKQTIAAVLLLGLLTACGGNKKGGATLAQEICDCYKKANAMDAADPGRAKAQQDCLAQQGAAWNKIKDDTKESAAYNDVFAVCSKEMIRSSFGK